MFAGFQILCVVQNNHNFTLKSLKVISKFYYLWFFSKLSFPTPNLSFYWKLLCAHIIHLMVWGHSINKLAVTKFGTLELYLLSWSLLSQSLSRDKDQFKRHDLTCYFQDKEETFMNMQCMLWSQWFLRHAIFISIHLLGWNGDIIIGMCLSSVSQPKWELTGTSWLILW